MDILYVLGLLNLNIDDQLAIYGESDQNKY